MTPSWRFLLPFLTHPASVARTAFASLWRDCGHSLRPLWMPGKAPKHEQPPINDIRRHCIQFMSLAVLAGSGHRMAIAHGNKPGSSAAVVPVVKEQKPWGIAAEPKEATRRLEIRMTDGMRFAPSHIDVREGETLRLRAVNRGRIMHEIVIGTREELEAHAALMKKFPMMEHEEPYMAHVAPGKHGDIVWTFNRPGDFEFACLIPGHFEAGMRGTIRVIPRT